MLQALSSVIVARSAFYFCDSDETLLPNILLTFQDCGHSLILRLQEQFSCIFYVSLSCCCWQAPRQRVQYLLSQRYGYC
jgi:hypothetical protein